MLAIGNNPATRLFSHVGVGRRQQAACLSASYDNDTLHVGLGLHFRVPGDSTNAPMETVLD